ncbi:hypothetical protein CKO12_03880 [Chromatium okenii]|uniref:hypothetical protein n=1 Tax=Chromatium okenii TaxID=61644 RepID=UPI001907ABCF|nr:hypothetical protein [Chromatium okenii]MBK1641030.1 hypothetical protein [Chromatium okenii]
MHQSSLQFAARITLLSTALFTVGAWHSANAASACKGLDETACAANTECRWQAGYARKDGAQIAAHCRAVPKKKEPAATPAPAAAPTPADAAPVAPAAVVPKTAVTAPPVATPAAPAPKTTP